MLLIVMFLAADYHNLCLFTIQFQFNSGASNCVVLFYLDVKVALFTRSNF